MSNQKPSLAGVRSTGLEINKRPQPVPTAEKEDRVSTQHPNNPTPSSRGYA